MSTKMMISSSLKPTPRTPITPRTPKISKKHHNKHEIDNIPSQRFKVGYQKVTLDIDLENNSIQGETEITILPQDSYLKQVKLDCRGIQIKSIIVNQRRANYSYDDFLQNQEYMNDGFNPVLSDYQYDPFFDSNSENISIHQHNMLRTKFYPLFSDQNNPDDPNSSFSVCTSELTIDIPESIKLRLQNSSKLSFSPAGTSRSLNGTPNTMNNSDKVYTPLNIKIIYKVKNSKNGIQFHGGKSTNIPRNEWYCYTLNDDFGCSTSSWVPCIDNFYEKPAWDINIVVPKTLADIGKSLMIGTKEAERALQKLSNQNNVINDQDKRLDVDGNMQQDDENEEEAEEAVDTVVVVPDFVSSRESPHPLDVAKKYVNFQFYNPVCAHHLGFAVGYFEKMPMIDLKSGSDELSINDQNIQENHDNENSAQFGIDTANTNKVPTLIYYHPGRKEEVINTTLFLYKALEFYSKEFSSFPFTSYTLLFIDTLPSSTCSFAGMTIASSNLLYGPKRIEPMFSTTEKLSIALAEQYSGVNVLPKTLNDIWCTIGISSYMGLQFLRKMFGMNYYKFLVQERCQLLCELDINKRPLANQLFRFPINSDQDLNFIRLKAPLILIILDKRITKTDKLFGLSRVIPKIFLQAMSNDLINGNNLSTLHFQRVCEKVAHHKLEIFFQNWVFNAGVPNFRIMQKFNKKRLFIEMSIRQMQTSSLKGESDDYYSTNTTFLKNYQHEDFVEQANCFIIEDDQFKPQAAFVGPVTVRIHEAHGAPYEHIMSISDVLTKLDIQYNTKYRRKRKDKPDEVEEEADEKEKEKNKKKEKVEEKPFIMGNVLMTSEEIKNWELKEEVHTSNNENENKEGETADEEKDQAFEWLRFDSDNEWICKYTINLTDETFESQLKRDKDIEAQIQSIRHFAAVNKPTLYHAKVMLRTLIDKKYFFGIRVEAAKALAHMSSEENDHIGMRFLLKSFKYMFCYDHKIVAGYNELDPNEYLPLPNDFTDFSNLFVSRAILVSLASVRNKNGDTPIELKQIMLHIFKYLDNSSNKFDDTDFYCSFIVALCDLIVVSNKIIHDLEASHDKENTNLNRNMDSNALFVLEAIKELNRCVKMDEWSPSYQRTVTKVILQQKIRFVQEGLATMSFLDLLKYTTPNNEVNIRLVAFEGLLILGGLKNKHVLNYFFTTLKLDESHIIKYELIKILLKSIGVAADVGIGSIMDDEEFLEDIEDEDGIKNKRGGAIQIDDISAAKATMRSRVDELARKSMKGSIELLRKTYGFGEGLQVELWDSLNSCLIPINTRRNILDIMMILYKPENSFIVTTRLYNDKKIVCKLKDKHIDDDDPLKSSLVVSLRREARFKIQLPLFKTKTASKKLLTTDPKSNQQKALTAGIDSSSKSAPIIKQAVVNDNVSIKKTASKFEVNIKLPISNIKHDNIIRHDVSSPLRYVKFNFKTKNVFVSTNDRFEKTYSSKSRFVTLKIAPTKLAKFTEQEFPIKTENTTDIATSTIVTKTVIKQEEELESFETMPMMIPTPPTQSEPVNKEKEDAANDSSVNEKVPDDKGDEKASEKTDEAVVTKVVSKTVTPENKTKEVAPIKETIKESPKETKQTPLFKSTTSADKPDSEPEPKKPIPKAINWGEETKSIVGSLNAIKKSSSSSVSPTSSHFGSSRSRTNSPSPDNLTDSSESKEKKGPKIKLRLK